MKHENPLSSAVIAELQVAADKASRGLRDFDEMRKACAAMDRLREENCLKYGTQDVGVGIIREMRDRE